MTLGRHSKCIEHRTGDHRPDSGACFEWVSLENSVDRAGFLPWKSKKGTWQQLARCNVTVEGMAEFGPRRAANQG